MFNKKKVSKFLPVAAIFLLYLIVQKINFQKLLIFSEKYIKKLIYIENLIEKLYNLIKNKLL